MISNFGLIFHSTLQLTYYKLQLPTRRPCIISIFINVTRQLISHYDSLIQISSQLDSFSMHPTRIISSELLCLNQAKLPIDFQIIPIRLLLIVILLVINYNILPPNYYRRFISLFGKVFLVISFLFLSIFFYLNIFSSHK